MSGLDVSLCLLNKSTFTEYRYNQLYVDNQCCCIVSLVNRILFYLFSSFNCVLRDAAGPVSIQEEQAAIRSYNSTKSALLLEQNERTIEAFNKAFNKRAKQLYTFDTHLTASLVEKWWKNDIQDEKLYKTVGGFQIAKAKRETQSSLERVLSLFAQNRNVEEEPLKQAIKSYANTLRSHVDAFDLGLAFLYKRFDEDVFEACWENNRRVPGEIAVAKKDSRFIQLDQFLSLKWAIFQLLPYKEDANCDELFLQIYSSECERLVWGKGWRNILGSKTPYSTMIQTMAIFVPFAENVYKKLALHLQQIDDEASVDTRGFIILVASHAFNYVSEDVVEACYNKLESELTEEEPECEEFAKFVTAHHAFTSGEADQDLEIRRVVISSIADRILKASAAQT